MLKLFTKCLFITAILWSGSSTLVYACASVDSNLANTNIQNKNSITSYLDSNAQNHKQIKNKIHQSTTNKADSHHGLNCECCDLDCNGLCADCMSCMQYNATLTTVEFFSVKTNKYTTSQMAFIYVPSPFQPVEVPPDI